MKRTSLLALPVVAVIAVGGCSNTDRTKKTDASRDRAGTAAVGTGGTAATKVKGDEDFVHDVALMSMAEVELSRMALGKATSPDVKSFAQRVVNDHGATADKLKGAVSAYQIEWPAQLDDKNRKTLDELATKQGAEFDRDYAKAMVHGDQDLAAKLESRLDLQTLADWKAAAAGRTQSNALPEPKVEMRDVAVRPEKSDNAITMKINQWAAETYPVTQKHLDTARTLENAMKKGSTN
jgi:putative membrane protein